MTTAVEYATVTSKPVPQSEPLSEEQVPNRSGGFVYEVDDWAVLDRFLILGAEGNTYYARQEEITKDSTKVLQRLIAKSPERFVDRIAEVSDLALAPRNSPAIFALALACNREAAPDERQWHADDMRFYAYKAVNVVCRTSTHLFEWLGAMKAVREIERGEHGVEKALSGRGVVKAIQRWYNAKTDEELLYQVTKYRNRHGWTHADAIRLGHLSSKPGSVRSIIYKFALGIDTDKGLSGSQIFNTDEEENIVRLGAFLWMRDDGPEVERVKRIIDSLKFTWEMIPDGYLKEKRVWEALVDHMPVMALIRHLAKLSNIGVIDQISGHDKIEKRITNPKALKRARIHPVQVLNAYQTYRSGKGFRGNLEWNPSERISDALDKAFELSFENIEPSGMRFYLGVDCSPSMMHGQVAGLAGISPREAAAAMTMATVRTEPFCYVAGFSSSGEHAWDWCCGSNGMTALGIGRASSISQAIDATQLIKWGGTDCSLPMLDALEKGLRVDVFVIYTDNETYAGRMHPAEALRRYRKRMGIDAKLVIVAFDGSKFSIADPKDRGMLDMVGFDSSGPKIISAFAKGEL